MMFIPPASKKQLKFLHDLENKTGIYFKTEPRTSRTAAKRIKKLLAVWQTPTLL